MTSRTYTEPTTFRIFSWTKAYESEIIDLLNSGNLENFTLLYNKIKNKLNSSHLVRNGFDY